MTQFDDVLKVLDNLRLDMNARLDQARTGISNILNPPIPTVIYDSYPLAYNFTQEGVPSQDGKWMMGYHGINPVNSNDVGKCGVVVPADAGQPGIPARVMQLYPYSLNNTTPKWGQVGHKTSASLVVTTQSWGDIELTIPMRTMKQLRYPTGDRWEVAWLMWHFNTAGYKLTEKGAHFHHYYITIYNDGTLEFGRKDNNTQTEHQYFLTPANTPKAIFTLGKFNLMKVRQIANHITIWIDGKQMIDLVDDGTKGTPGTDNTLGPAPHHPSEFMYSGNVALYNEDARVQFGQLIISKPQAV